MIPIKSLITVLFTSADSRTINVGEFYYELTERELSALFNSSDRITYREFLAYYEANPEAVIPQDLATALVKSTLDYGPIEDYVYLSRSLPDAKP